MSKTKFFNLSAITSRIQQILQPHIGKQFWVKAEISSGRERGGSFYCDLVETSTNGKILAKVRCNIWNRDLSRIKKNFKDHDLELKLDDGTTIGLQCALQYHPTYGLSLHAVNADPTFALGELELKKKEILDRLIKEGLLETQKNLFTSMLPQRIGLITSQGSAAYNDFIKTLKTSSFGFKIYLADCVVQGDRAEKTILKGLSRLEKLKIDLVVIIRGGGSKTELFSLDNEAIARKIASYKFPVWTGIGHEVDLSILDHVANQSFKTPTAVAEEIVARYVDMNRRLDEAKNRFNATWSYRLKMETRWLSEAKTGIRQGTRKLLDTQRIELKNDANILSSKVNNRLFTEKSSLSIAKKTLSTAPSNMLIQAKDKNKTTTRQIQNSCHRIFIDKQRIIHQIKDRFALNRYIQRICQEKCCVEDWTNRYARSFNSQIKSFKNQLTYHVQQFRLEKVLVKINNEKTKLASKSSIIRASDPKTSLHRGFSIVYSKEGHILKSVSQINVKDVINTEMKDGQIQSTVQQIKEKK